MSETNSKYDPQRADANNPNNNAFWTSRGYKKRPENWKLLAPALKDKESTSSKKRARKRFPADGGYDYPLCKDDY